MVADRKYHELDEKLENISRMLRFHKLKGSCITEKSVINSDIILILIRFYETRVEYYENSPF